MKKLLFITKNYPPAVGGMENYCRDLVQAFRTAGVEVILIANGQGVKGLPWFAIRAFFLGLWYSFQVDAIRVGDGSISAFGRLFSKLSRTPWYVTIHALDITRDKKIYQSLIPKIVSQADHAVAVSTYSKQQCVMRGIPAQKITVIPNGIDAQQMHDLKSESDLREQYALPQEKKILFSIGRHIERKGIHRFLEEVMPILGDEYVYMIAGSGPWTQTYQDIIDQHGLASSVKLIGRISDEEKIAWYQQSDRFVMPNIHVPGDAEGFGIVCIEAAWYGLPILASAIEGITDAVIDGKTGIQLSTYDPEIRKESLQHRILVREEVKKTARETFAWSSLINLYKGVINEK